MMPSKKFFFLLLFIVCTISVEILISKGKIFEYTDSSIENCSNTKKLSIDNPLFRIKQKEKWGFIDLKGKIVIPPIFEDAHDFVDEIAIVKKNGKYGYIDTSGDFILPPKYDWATPFSEKLALVEVKNRWGYINHLGVFKINPIFTVAHPFNEGVAKVKVQKKWNFIDKNGDLIAEEMYDELSEFSNEKALFLSKYTKGKSSLKKVGIIDVEGNIISEFDEKNLLFEGLPIIKNGLINYWIHDCNLFCRLGFIDARRRKRWGYIYSNGQEAIPPKFAFANSFSDCYASVEFLEQDKYGYINTSGKIVIPPHFDDARDFKKGIASVETNQLWGFIDYSGKFIVRPQFSEVRDFSNGFAFVKINEHRKWGFIDSSGVLIVESKFDKVQDFSNGLAYVSIDNMNGYIDKSGKFVWLTINGD